MQNVDIPFTGSPGLKVRMPPDATSLDYYKLFLTRDIMDLILIETNRFGAAKHADWKPIVTNDLERLFALVMLTGIIRKPTLKLYWSNNPMLSTPYFNSIMSRDKFMRILGALHFVDNDAPTANRINKIHPIIEKLNRKFADVYKPKKHIAIDETLLLWKGRLVFKQYIPKKRARFGMKGYVMAESDTGYVARYTLYQGRDRENADIGQGVAHKITMDMMDGLLNLGHELIMDNWYSSPILMKELYENGTYAYGTLRSNRKHVPKDIKERRPGETIKKGECQYFTCPPVLTACWLDKNYIHFCSNKHSSFELVEIEKRTHDDQPIMKPSPIVDYNTHMGGVDLADQMAKYYHMDRRTIKWYKKLFFHLLDLSVHNTYVIYQCHKQTQLPALKFRLELIDRLLLAAGPDVECHGGRGGRPRSSGTDLARLNSYNHYPAHNPTSDVTGRVKFRRCRVCNKPQGAHAANRKRNETQYCCVQCGEVPLCPAPCFDKYHNMLNF